LKSCTHNTM